MCLNSSRGSLWSVFRHDILRFLLYLYIWCKNMDNFSCPRSTKIGSVLYTIAFAMHARLANLTRYFTQWISKFPWRFEIHRVRQYLINIDSFRIKVCKHQKLPKSSNVSHKSELETFLRWFYIYIYICKKMMDVSVCHFFQLHWICLYSLSGRTWLREFTRFGGKTSYCLVNRGPDTILIIFLLRCAYYSCIVIKAK